MSAFSRLPVVFSGQSWYTHPRKNDRGGAPRKEALYAADSPPDRARAAGRARLPVLVTLISSNGSAPRKAGSQMLAGGAGLLAGTIGGGAVEGHSLELAARLRVERRSDVRRFPLHPGERGDIGMICGGGRHRALPVHPRQTTPFGRT